jgi:hypothetical protein
MEAEQLRFLAELKSEQDTIGRVKQGDRTKTSDVIAVRDAKASASPEQGRRHRQPRPARAMAEGPLRRLRCAAFSHARMA